MGQEILVGLLNRCPDGLDKEIEDREESVRRKECERDAEERIQQLVKEIIEVVHDVWVSFPRPFLDQAPGPR
jgi:hypothetical protein